MAYEPLKYFSGLTKTRKIRRRKEIRSRSKLSWKNPRAYRPFSTDKGAKTRKSSYTAKWQRKFPGSHGLSDGARNSGVPIRFLRESYNRGMAAWRTGHRPGATQEQWGYARVYSMLLKGKTYYSTDSDIVRRAKESSEAARKWWNKV
jgi:hypothetical protein